MIIFIIYNQNNFLNSRLNFIPNTFQIHTFPALKLLADPFFHRLYYQMYDINKTRTSLYKCLDKAYYRPFKTHTSDYFCFFVPTFFSNRNFIFSRVPCFVEWVVEVRLDCDGAVGVCVGERLPKERLPF